MNTSKLELGDRMHVFFTLPTEANTDLITSTTFLIGKLVTINTVRGSLLLHNGIYTRSYDNNETEKGSFDLYNVPFNYNPIILCERLLCMDLNFLTKI